jgi:hypothetical protein
MQGLGNREKICSYAEKLLAPGLTVWASRYIAAFYNPDLLNLCK